MKKYYDKDAGCLVYVGQKANEAFWDSRWKADDFQALVKVAAKRNKYFVDYTKKYLPTGARVLEGGCGRGDKVYSLHNSGFDAYGVDFAPETVGKINQFAPELKVLLGDVRNLQFEDSFFDGYWSLGVIEHFYNGYEPIQKEMHRVIKSGGYLFLTVPSMSWARKQKANWNIYPLHNKSEEIQEQFYQFALDPQNVIRSFQNHGFLLMELRLRNGFIGFRDEIGWQPIQRILDKLAKGKDILSKRMRKVIDLLTTPFANHGILCVFRKN